MPALRQMLTVAGAILATGAVLNMAGQGMFGQTIQRAAAYITRGYGV